VFGGPAWHRLPDGDWYLHLFAPEQPDLNWLDPAVPAEFERIMRFWLDRGVDGFRVDVAHSMAKEPDLPDMDLTVLEAMHSPMHPSGDIRWDRDALHEHLRMFRRLLDSYPGERMAVGEAWVADPDRLARYVRPDELNLTFNFELVESAWGAKQFRTAIEQSLDSMGRVGAPATWVLSNHDVDRAATRYGGGPEGVARARAAALVQLSLPGTAYLYNGDELGLENVDLPETVLQDPTWERSGHTDRGRDGERVPLPWTGGEPPFGFSATPDTWLPMPTSWAGLTAEDQAADPASTLNLFRAALRLRRESTGLRSLELEWLDGVHDRGPGDVLGYRRGDLLVLLNTGPDAVPLPDGEVVLSSRAVTTALPPDTTVWLRPS
jgi:alpha-glucosidase